VRRAGALAAAAVAALVLAAGPAGAAGHSAGSGPATPRAPATTPTRGGHPAPGPSGFSRQDRGLVLVVLTFVVGIGLLGIGREDADAPASPARRPITLYDDPTAPVFDEPARRVGRPPPLR